MSPRYKAWLVRSLPWLALVTAVVVVATLGLDDDAWGRLGGGQSFSSGRSRGGGFSGSGGSSSGGGGGGDLIFLVIWLLIEHPAIGVPVLLVVVTFFVVRAWMGRGGQRMVQRTHHYDQDLDGLWGAAPQTAADPRPLAAIRKSDPGFSEPVLLDYLQLVHRRATDAAVTGDWDPLLPFVTEDARKQLTYAHRDVREVRDVVVGGLRFITSQVHQDRSVLQVVYEDTRFETLDDGSVRHVFVEENWVFMRKAGVTSKAPEDVLRMGCPSCGNAVDTDREGRCRSCGTPIVKGMLQWTAHSVEVGPRRVVKAPTVGWMDGGEEPSVRYATRADPDLPRAWRDFRGRHPGFEPAAFNKRVDGIYHALQTAWSDGRWDQARPHVTDTLFQTLRFAMEQYTENGLHNRLADVRLDRQEIVRVQMDAWYEAITVRIWGGMRDWIETKDGKVVGGQPKTERRFSEYWTFVRAIGSGDGTGDALHCPSCGAPLDKISQAGVCGYCDSRITTGRFDWVLSRIDQPEVYRG